jgi:hypothetical protein
MSPRYVIIGVEGPTDQAVIGRILKLLGFKRLEGRDSSRLLDPFWEPFRPKYPRTGDLYKRLDMPSIFTSSKYSVAVYGGEGSNLASNLSAIIENNESFRTDLNAIGIIADADRLEPTDVSIKYHGELKALFPNFPKVAGQIIEGPPRLGIFVVPDNVSRGVIEHLVIECGRAVYAPHMQRAHTFVNAFDEAARKKAKWAPFDEQKALVATVVSVLKPGKTNTVSLADNDWIGEETRDLPLLSALIGFCRRLLPDESAAAGAG